MDIRNILDKLDAVSPTDFIAQARIAEEHWVEIINTTSVEDYREFSEVTMTLAILGHALVEQREKKKAIKLIDYNLAFYDKYSSQFEVSLTEDLFYDKVLFDKVVCLEWMGKKEDSARLLKTLRQLKPDEKTYEKWEKTVSINKLFYWDKVISTLGYGLIVLELVLRYLYNIRTNGIYTILGFVLLGIGYILKKRGLKKKETI